jgi:hypothetical protein
MTVSDLDWMMAGLYMAVLVTGGTFFMSALARRTLSKLKERGH